MDTYALLRTLGALALVLGLLTGSLWVVRRYGIRLPGRISSGGPRRLEVVERAALDGRRSVALLRRDGREHLILLSPEGHVLLEAGIVQDETDHAAEAARTELERQAAEASRADSEALRESFSTMVDKARTGLKGRVVAARPVLKQVASRLAVREKASQADPAEADEVELSAPAPSAPPPPAPKRPAKAAQPRKRAQSGSNRPRAARASRG